MKYVDVKAKAFEPVEVALPHVPAASEKPYMSYGKRLLDLCLALLMLPIVLPVILIACLVVRRDGAAGLFTQERIGKDAKPFKCYKIRTMVPDAEARLQEYLKTDPEIAREWTVNQKLRKDPRITKTGGFLRSSSIDELPQIFNVIRGDMSFLGPRPFMSDQEEMYRAAGGSAYFHLRPGISGPWQVYGRGETSFAARVDFDNKYLRNLSLMNDLALIFHTIRVVVSRSGH